MERKALHRLLVLAVVVLTPVGLNSQLAVAADTDDDQRPRIAPIQTKPEGQTYGRWAAEWWQWVLGIPAVVTRLQIRWAKIVVSARWIGSSSWPAPTRLPRSSAHVRFRPGSRCSSRSSTTFTGISQRPTGDPDRGVCARGWELHRAGADFSGDRWLQSLQAAPVLYRSLGQPVADLQRAVCPPAICLEPTKLWCPS